MSFVDKAREWAQNRPKTSNEFKALVRDGVPDSPEVRRIRALTPLDPVPQIEMPGLRPSQREALSRIKAHRSWPVLLPTGEGKTLTFLLAPHVLGAKDPLLLLPSSLLKKTEEDCKRYAAMGFPVQMPRTMTYQKLGRKGAKVPACDLLLCEEAQYLKSTAAHVTQHVHRFHESNPQTPICLFSATLSGTSLMNLHHLLKWLFGDDMPLPRTAAECMLWARAIDPNVEYQLALKRGALDFDVGEKITSRSTFIASSQPTQPIYVHVKKIPLTFDMKKYLRRAEDGQRPDGGPVYSMQSLQKTIPLGFYYRPTVEIPEKWMKARRAFQRFMADVVPGVDYSKASEVLEWNALKDEYQRTAEGVWFDYSVIDRAHDMCKGTFLHWTQHRPVGEHLPPYFAEGGMCNGTLIDHFTETATVSIFANKEGRNLQQYSRNVLSSIPRGADILQQLLSRTHRAGQQADAVEVFLLLSGPLYEDRLNHILTKGAPYQEEITRTKQKIQLADIIT